MSRPRRLTVLVLILGAVAALELWARLAEPPPPVVPHAVVPHADRIQRPPGRQVSVGDARSADRAAAHSMASATTSPTTGPTPSATPAAAHAVPLAQALQLFGPATRPGPSLSAPRPAPTPAPVPEAMPPEAPPPPVRARGLYSEPGQAPQVLLEDSRGELALRRVGAALDGVASGWLIEALDAESVVLRQHDGERRHRLALPVAP